VNPANLPNPANPVLSCSVRDCGLPLFRSARTWSCSSGHTFDIAQSGYVNLLQPQDRRSLEAGDAGLAVEARARTIAGPGRELFERFVERAATLPFADHGSVVDLGCGSGELLAALAQVRRINGIGLDLSTAAVDRAARKYPELTWVVANADRRLPLLDGRVSLVLSLHARRNPQECARALGHGGHLLVAVPADDDLAELREAVQGSATRRDRGESLIAAHRECFTLIDHATARYIVDVTPEQLLDLLSGTYRGARRANAGRIECLRQMTVTFASEFFLFGRG
jgi:23S rRNA (guanine745-N1)-methyltransferase